MPKKGYKLADEHKQKLIDAKAKNNIWVGRKHTPEARKKMSLSHKGKKLTKEHRRSLSLAKSEEKHYNWKGGISKKGQKDYLARKRKEMSLQPQ